MSVKDSNNKIHDWCMAGKTYIIIPCLCYHANKTLINHLFQFSLGGHPGGHALDHSQHVSDRKDRTDRILQQLISIQQLSCQQNSGNKLNSQVPFKCILTSLIMAQLMLIWWWRANDRIQGNLTINRLGAWTSQMWIILFLFSPSFQSSTIFMGHSTVIFTGGKATI